jgi:hypothetical protein
MNKIKSSLLIVLLVCAVASAPAPATFAGVITPLPPNAQVTDAGLTDLADAVQPGIAVLGNTIYATWLDDRLGGSQPDVYFSKSTDGGATWGANVRVSEVPYDDWPDDPVITVQPNGVIWIAWYLFYTSGSNTVNDVRLARSTNGGQSWERYTVVDGVNDNSDLWRPAIASDDARVFVLYRLKGSSGGEAGFELRLKVVDTATLNVTTTTVTDVPVPGRVTGGLLDDGPATTLIQRDGVLCAAWEDRRSTFAIYSACSTNNGASFSANAPVSGPNAIYPVIALAPDGTLYATYAASSDARSNIILRSSTDRGATWGAPRQITNMESPFKVGVWDLAIDANGQVLLSWINDGTSANDVVLSTSVDGGANFNAVLPVEDGQGTYPTISDPWGVKIAASGEGTTTRAHLVWTDNRNTKGEIWSGSAALDGVAPTAPANLQAQGEDASILLTWQPATDASGVRGYRVYRAASAGGPFTEITPLLVNATFYRDVGLDGATYFYTVAAVDATGNTGPQSNVANAAAQTGGAPAINGAIAYQSGADIKIRNLADGSERTIANANGPEYSTDGQRLYLHSSRTIFWRPADGDQTTTFAGPFESGVEFDIAGDNTAFAIVDIRQFGSPGAPGGLCTVTEPHYFERAGQEKYVGTNALTNGIAIAADRRWIAYRYSGFCNVAGSGVVSPPDFCLVRTADGTETCVKGADYREPDFAPSGNWVTFAAPLSGQLEIWKARVQDDGSLSNYTQLTRGPTNQPARMPTFSTDSNWIVFTRDVDPGNGENFELFVVRNDGFGVRPLNVPGEYPAWRGGGSAPPPQGLSNKIHVPLVAK